MYACRDGRGEKIGQIASRHIMGRRRRKRWLRYKMSDRILAAMFHPTFFLGEKLHRVKSSRF
jgi:hypothetical protein